MKNSDIVLSVIIGFSIFGSAYCFVEIEKEKNRSINEIKEQEFREAFLSSQQQMQAEIGLIRKAVAPTNEEIKEYFNMPASTNAEITNPDANFLDSTLKTSKSYEEIVDERQRKADEINNSLFPLHQ